MFSFIIHFLSLRALSHHFSLLLLVQLHMHGEILAQKKNYRANVNLPNLVSFRIATAGI